MIYCYKTCTNRLPLNNNINCIILQPSTWSSWWLECLGLRQLQCINRLPLSWCIQLFFFSITESHLTAWSKIIHSLDFSNSLTLWFSTRCRRRILSWFLLHSALKFLKQQQPAHTHKHLEHSIRYDHIVDKPIFYPYMPMHIENFKLSV